MEEKEIIPYHRPMIRYRESHILSNGPLVRELENRIKEMYDVEYAIACSSCTQGLMISLSWFPQERIINIPAFEWKSVKYLLLMMNFNIHYQDINPRTWLMPIDLLNMHHYLQNFTFGNVDSSIHDNIIVDGAHALGADIKNFGLATVFSLAPTKLITSCEGGIILTNNQEFAEMATEVRDKISRMSEPNADWGLYTLEGLEEVKEFKKYAYQYYKKRLPGIFQEIPLSSSYNTIGMLTDLKIPPHIECRKYYEPLSFEEHLKATKLVFNKIVCLPSWFGVDLEKIVEDILEYNESLDNGRIGIPRTGNSQAPPL